MDLPVGGKKGVVPKQGTLAWVEMQHIKATLSAFEHEGMRALAARLGVTKATFYYKLKKYGIVPNRVGRNRATYAAGLYKHHRIAKVLGVLLTSIFLGACAPSVKAGFPRFRQQPVFLVAGQSNGVSPAQEHAPYWSQTGRTAVTDFYGTGEIVIPTEASPINGSIAWIYAGDYLNRDVTFENIARGNQSTARWNDVHFEALMKPALESGTYDAILWIQGESDIGEHFTEEQTYQNMKSLILKAKAIAPNTPWIVALNSRLTNPAENSVRKAQRRIIYEGLALLGPDTDTLRENPHYMEDTFGEFVGEGLREHGRLWANVLSKGF